MNYLAISTLLSPIFYFFSLYTHLSPPDDPSTEQSVYIQTDRKIYASGEVVYFKTFDLRADHSSTSNSAIQVELINTSGEVVQSMLVKCSKGSAKGNLRLNSALSDGYYMIRAFSLGMKDYDVGGFARKEIYLKKEENAIPIFSSEGLDNMEDAAEIFVDIITEKEEYQRDEIIRLELEVFDIDGDAVAGDFLISVAHEDFSNAQINDLKINALAPSDTKRTLISNGITISGQVHTHSGKGVAANGIMSLRSFTAMTKRFSTDEDGRFELEDVDLEGEVELLFQVERKNGKGSRNLMISFDSTSTPAIMDADMPKGEVALDMASTAISEELLRPQYWTNDTYLDDIAMTEEIDNVTITAEKVDEVIESYRNDMMYGNPDDRVMSNSIPRLHQYLDIYDYLKGRVPGMTITRPQIQEAGPIRSKVIRLRGTQTGLSSSLPMSYAANFMVNGVFVSYSYAESIIPSEIAFVDVIRSKSKLAVYGEQGVNGVIAIYLVNGARNPSGTSKSILKDGYAYYRLKGYQPTQDFASTVSTDKMKRRMTRRNTALWYPDLKISDTGKATLEFYAPMDAGTYDVIVEGITEGGQPVIAHSQLKVK